MDEFAATAGPRYFVLESSSERESQTLSQLVKAAVLGKTYQRNMKAILSRMPPENPEVEHIGVNEALASQSGYNRTLRALCRAEIAVIDVTNYELGVMLFLGIRTIARRGVTIVTSNGAMSTVDWSKLPFNLKEMYPVPAREAFELGGLMSNAWGRYKGAPHYMDLPGWQVARQTARDDAAIDPEKSILWLCSFSAEYSSEGFEEHLRTVLKDQFEAGSTLERITDVISPQLLAQRLYSALRFRKLCIVDWTFWSPNVFFELGVRLAINRFGPVCLLSLRSKDDEGVSDAVKLQREHLKKLFDPILYETREDPPGPFPEIKRRYEQMKETELPQGRSSISAAFGSFPYDHTYIKVRDYLNLEDEPGGVAPHEWMIRMINSLVGEGASNPGSPVLFVDNEKLADQVRHSATAIGVAAWLYMSYRLCSPETLDTVLQSLRDDAAVMAADESIRRRYEEVGTRLSSLLKMSSDSKDARLAEVVGAVQEKLRRPAPGSVDAPASSGGDLLATQLSFFKGRVRSSREDMLNALEKGDIAKADADFQLARQAIEDGFRIMEGYEKPNPRSAEPIGEGEQKVAQAMADLYGIRGGLYRSRGITFPEEDGSSLDAAIKAYDEGWFYESSERFKILNSYNTVNRLVLRILREPAILQRDEPVAKLGKRMADLLDDAAALIA